MSETSMRVGCNNQYAVCQMDTFLRSKCFLKIYLTSVLCRTFILVGIMVFQPAMPDSTLLSSCANCEVLHVGFPLTVMLIGGAGANARG